MCEIELRTCKGCEKTERLLYYKHLLRKTEFRVQG